MGRAGRRIPAPRTRSWQKPANTAGPPAYAPPASGRRANRPPPAHTTWAQLQSCTLATQPNRSRMLRWPDGRDNVGLMLAALVGAKPVPAPFGSKQLPVLATSFHAPTAHLPP